MKKHVMCIVASLLAMWSLSAVSNSWASVSTTAIGFGFGNPHVKMKAGGTTIADGSLGTTTTFTMIKGISVEGANYFDAKGTLGILYGLSFDPAIQATSDNDVSEESSQRSIGLSALFSYRLPIDAKLCTDFDGGLFLSAEHEKNGSDTSTLRSFGLVFKGGLMYALTDRISLRTGLDMLIPLYEWGKVKASGSTIKLSVTPRTVEFQIPVGIAFSY